MHHLTWVIISEEEVRTESKTMRCFTQRSHFSAPMAGLVSTMLSCLLSRTLCHLTEEVSRRSCPALGSSLRYFASSRPRCGEEPCSDSVVTYSQLNTMLSNRDIQLFDVRTLDEYQAGYIADAVNIPLDNLDVSLKLSPEQFQQKFEVRAPGKDDNNIVFYCRSGVRSAKALAIAHQLGLCMAKHYKGGYSEWAEQQGK